MLEIMIMLRTLMKMVLVLVILSMIFCRFRHCLFCSGLGVNDLAVFHIVFSNDSHLCLSSYPQSSLSQFETDSKQGTKFFTWWWIKIVWMMTLVKIWSMLKGKNQTNATNATIRHLRQVIWGDIWQRIVEKRQINASSVNLHPLVQMFWGHILKRTAEKS